LIKKNDSQMMFELPAIGVDRVPEVLRAGLEDNWRNFIVAAEEAGVAPPLNSDLLNVLCKVWACSEFVAKACVRDPAMWADLVHSGDLMADYYPQRYLRELHASLADTKAVPGAISPLVLTGMRY
jgi:glutamate-ammonia-ligase adenylyltransferase